MTVPQATPLVVPPGTTTPADGGIAEVWRNLIPYDDLQAKGIPERHLTLGRDILITLSSLVGNGPTGPKMIVSDLQGKLATANLPYFVDTAAGPAAIGSNNVLVNNPQLYVTGAWALFGSAVVSGSVGAGQYLQIGTVIGNLVGVQQTFRSAIAAGDPIILLPPPQLVYGAVRKRRYDWSVVADPGVGVQAIATIPQQAGFLQIIDKISADQINGQAALFSGNVTIQNPLAVPTSVWTRWFITQAVAGDREHIKEDDMAFRLPDAANNTVQFNAAPPAGGLQVVSVAGWYEPQGFFL